MSRGEIFTNRHTVPPNNTVEMVVSHTGIHVFDLRISLSLSKIDSVDDVE